MRFLSHDTGCAVGYGKTAACSLLNPVRMEFICRHCNEVCAGDAYRVRSEEDGVILLDMIVCYACSQEARGLELWTQKIDLPVETGQPVFH